MTMIRTEKATHQDLIDTARNSKTGNVPGITFQSPTEIMKRNGRKSMTVAEYIKFRMVRGARVESSVRSDWAEKRAGRRKITRR